MRIAIAATVAALLTCVMWVGQSQAEPPAGTPSSDPIPPPPGGSSTPPAPTPPPVSSSPAPTSAPAPEPAPPVYDPMAPQVLGPLRLTPRDPNLTMEVARGRAVIGLRVRFLLENVSSADTKVVLLGKTLSAVDDTGRNLLPQSNRRFEIDYSVTGIPACGAVPPNFQECFANPNAFLTLSPGQRVEMTVIGTNYGKVAVPDKNGIFSSQYRPRALSLSGSIGIRDLSGDTEIRSFAVVDAPIALQ